MRHREDEPGVLDRRPDSLLRLGDRGVRQTNNVESREPIADVNLDFDDLSLETDDGAAVGLASISADETSAHFDYLE